MSLNFKHAGKRLYDDLSWARDLSDAEWCAFLSGELDLAGRTPPPMPSPEFQSSWVGAAGLVALTEAMIFLSRMKAGMSEAGSPLRRDMRVLDFGAGWGRFYRILMRDVDSLVAADPDPPCIEMCRSMFSGGEFLQIPLLPPYPVRDGEFDLIYAYSVFTHLAAPVFAAVVREFVRIVKPGGFVAFTTLPLNCIDLFHEQGNYKSVMDQISFDPMSWHAKADAGEFLFLPTGGGGCLESPEIYGWSWIGRPYLERALQHVPFQILAMESLPGLPQEFVLLRSLVALPQ